MENSELSYPEVYLNIFNWLFQILMSNDVNSNVNSSCMHVNVIISFIEKL